MYTFDGFEFDATTLSLCNRGEPVPVARRARRVLHLLLSRKNQLVTRHEIFAAIWVGDEEGREAALNTEISRLRKALAEPPGGRRLKTIVTASSSSLGGYCFQLCQPGPTASAPAQDSFQADQAACDAFMATHLLAAMSLGQRTGKSASSGADILDAAAKAVQAGRLHSPGAQGMVWRCLGEGYLRLAYSLFALAAFHRAQSLLDEAGPRYREEALIAQFCATRALVENYRVAEAAVALDAACQQAGPLLDEQGLVAIHALMAKVDVLLAQNQPKPALAPANRLVQICKASPLLRSHDELVFEALARLGEVSVQLEDLRGARKAFDELRQPPYSNAVIGAVTRARVAIRFARVLWGQHQLSAAIRTLTLAEKKARQELGGNGPGQLQIAHVQFDLADYLVEAGEFNRARTVLTEAQTIFNANLDSQHGYRASADANAAILSLLQGDAAAALAGLEAAAKVYRSLKADTDGIDFFRGMALADLGRFEAALATLKDIRVDRLAFSIWAPADWEWRLQAERGHAIGALGNRSEGRRLIESAVHGMKQAGSLRWVIARHDAQLAALTDKD